MTYFGTNIKKIRQIKGLSQQAFAEILDLNRGVISSYEEGRAEPKIETLLRIATILDLTTDELLSKPITINKITNFNEIEDLVSRQSSNESILQEITPNNEVKPFDLQKILADIDFVFTVDDVLAGKSIYSKGNVLLLSSNLDKVDVNCFYLLFDKTNGVKISEEIEKNKLVYKIVGVIQTNQNISLMTSILNRLEKIESKLK
ncbi:helix-turn-helix domain-containing protein [Flavobacterium haoranii]|uniref:Transcriptional regulator, contains XRE-family HTH domain n=1 Tax=Flavobacterium haoranii TaxID=683124 RepID=A0A1M6KCQ8_9FLAO|nr:helix-turn-helix transcriptional regulator [Flavobacterium haoranii]SHJ56718.1 Transcriptional regulator, contains XRE-family HTH domain [Flavobacterium haoranii]